MKKLIIALCLLCMFNTSYAAVSNNMAFTMAAASAAIAAQTSQEAYKSSHTTGINSLIGKEIENCLIIGAFYVDYYLEIVCLNKFEDKVYDVQFSRVKGDFSAKVFEELRKSFNKEDK